MKVYLTLALGLFVGALLSCEGVRTESGSAGPGSIKLDEHSVVIPGTAISAADQEAVTRIFKKYDSSLYRIAVYENGSLKKQLGKMSEMQMGAVTSEYSSQAKASGLTNWAMQIGNTNHVTTMGNPNHITTAGNTNHVTTAGNPNHITTAGNPNHVTTAGNPNHITTAENTNHVTRSSQDSDALVKEVTPILEKYAR
jgi:hypothetical protein